MASVQILWSFTSEEQVMWKCFPLVIQKISVALSEMHFQASILSDKEYSLILIFFFFWIISKGF